MLIPGIPGLKIPLVKFFLGVILLTMGSRLFWLFVGVAGFIFGFDSAGRLLPHLPHDVLLAVALIVGFLCAVLAIYLQKIAIAVVGFLAGGHFFPQVLKAFGLAAHQHYWVLFIVGGIIGAVLMILSFDLALTVLTSLIGAHMILQSLHLGGRWLTVLFVCLSVLGIAVQYGLLRPKPGSKIWHL